MADEIVPAIAKRDLAHAGIERLPTIVTNAGPSGARRFVEFFAVTIRNRNTREAYSRAVLQFLCWCEDRGLRSLSEIQPLAAQKMRHAAGALSKDCIEIETVPFYVNDRVMFLENSSSLGVRNGQLGTIVALRPEEKSMIVQGDDDRRLVIPYANYPHISLGYAMTSAKAQAATMPNVYCLVPQVTCRETTVVQASRHALTCTFFVDELTAGPDLRDMAKAMSRSRKQVMAADVASRDPSYVVLRPEFQR